MKGSEALTANPSSQIVITKVPGSAMKYYVITNINTFFGYRLGAYIVDMSLPGYGTTGTPMGEVINPSSPYIIVPDPMPYTYGKSFLIRENTGTGTTLLYTTRYVSPAAPEDLYGHIEIVAFTLPADAMTVPMPEVMCRPLGYMPAGTSYIKEAQGELAFNSRGDELLYYNGKKQLGWFSHQSSDVLAWELGYDGKIAANKVAAKYTIPVSVPTLPGSSEAVSADGRFIYYTRDQLYITNSSAAHLWRYDLRNGSNAEVSGQNYAGDLRNMYSGLMVDVADTKSATGRVFKETDQGITQAGTNTVFPGVTGQIMHWPLQNFRIYGTPNVPKVSARRISNKRYELNDHLGNVTVVVSDRKLAFTSPSFSTKAEVVNYTNYYAFGMAIAKRSTPLSAYRYGYNGKEKDNDVEPGGYDFGARIYDARIAKFLSTDPEGYKYVSWSSYLFAANNPIRYVDIMGEGPGDVIGSHYQNGCANTMIILVDNKNITIDIDAIKRSAPGWNFVIVTNLSDATDWLERTYGTNNSKIDNLLIRTHGAGGFSICTHTTEHHDMTTRADLEAQHFADPDPNTKYGVAVNEFKKIGDYLSEDAIVLFSACNAGADEQLSVEVAKLMGADKNLSIYMNQAKTGILQPDDKGTLVGFVVEKPLTDPKEAYAGWTQTTKVNGEYTRRDLTTYWNMKVNQNGGFSFLHLPSKANKPYVDPNPVKSPRYRKPQL